MMETTVPAERVLGYARVSTDQQDLRPQVEFLHAAGAVHVFSDVMSGARADRPGLAALLAEAANGDTVMVWKLDRLGRSVIDIVRIVADLTGRGVVVRGLTDGATTATKEGRMLMTVLAAVAEYERGLILERTEAGRRSAKADGQVFGRRRVLTATAEDAILAALESGRSVMAVGRDWRVSERTVWRAVASARARRDRPPTPSFQAVSHPC